MQGKARSKYLTSSETQALVRGAKPQPEGTAEYAENAACPRGGNHRGAINAEREGRNRREPQKIRNARKCGFCLRTEALAARARIGLIEPFGLVSHLNSLNGRLGAANHARRFLLDARVQANEEVDQRDDLELVGAINGGDPAAFEVLYFRYRDWVAQLACRLTGDESAALDVLQETFLYVLRKFPGFRLTANFKTFLYPAVRNLSIAARRKAARYQTTDADRAQVEQAPSPQPAASGGAELNFLLAGLPEEQREVVLLRFVDGLTLAEVAGAMSVPVGTVKSRLHNALQTLRHDPRTKEFYRE